MQVIHPHIYYRQLPYQYHSPYSNEDIALDLPKKYAAYLLKQQNNPNHTFINYETFRWLKFKDQDYLAGVLDSPWCCFFHFKLEREQGYTTHLPTYIMYDLLCLQTNQPSVCQKCKDLIANTSPEDHYYA